MKQLVTLDFKKDQGLILKWNCVNFSRTNKYFRHIIVLLASNTNFARDALDGYIKNIKLGDLYTAVYNSKGVARVRGWREKTNHSQNALESYLK